MREAQFALLQSKFYADTPLGISMKEIRTECHTMAKKISEVSGENLVRELTRPCRQKGEIISVLMNTVKTHKEDGEVSLRPIHASSAYIFEGPAIWLGKLIKMKLAIVAPHIIKNSAAVRERVSKHEFQGVAKLIKIDIKDFFLSGSKSELISDVL